MLVLFKGLYVFYLELVTDLLHIFVYMVFFLIIMKYYGFPLHLVRVHATSAYWFVWCSVLPA